MASPIFWGDEHWQGALQPSQPEAPGVQAQPSQAEAPAAAALLPVQAEALLESEVVPAAPEQSAASRKFRRVYSVSFAAPASPDRASPAELSREEFAVLLTKRHVDVFNAGRATEHVPANKVVKVMVFRELHSDGQRHYYGVIMCERPYGCSQVQKKLMTCDKVYCSFGNSHTYFWTAVVYGAVPSEHKSADELDVEPYHSEGRTVREELGDMPRGVSQTEKARVALYLGMPAKAKSLARVDRVEDRELADRIVSEGWQTVADMAQAVGGLRASEPVLYDTVLRLGKKRAQELVDWTWSLQGPQAPAPGNALCTDGPARLQKLAATMENAQCVCGGTWMPAADFLLEHQGLQTGEFKRLVLRALRLGRRKTVNVLIKGAPDAGKSFLFRPLAVIFKAFETRGQTERFPLQGLPCAEVCVLQDPRYETFGLPWDDWLRWGDGDTVMINVPRNSIGASSVQYTGSAPLFATMCDVFSYPLREARQHGRDPERENIQWRSRWHIIDFARAIPPDKRDISLEPCAKCAATWLMEANFADDPSPMVAVGHQGLQPDVPESPASKKARVLAGRLSARELELLGLRMSQ